MNLGQYRDDGSGVSLKKGKPTYVAVWREDKGEVRLVEVIYAGTHEQAPY